MSFLANDMNSISRKLLVRTFLPTTVMVLLLVIVNFSIILPAFERNMLANKKVAAEDMIVIALDEINFYYKEYVEGKKSLELAQQRALDHLKTLRYGEKKNNYFWVFDLESDIMLMHASIPRLNNMDIKDIIDPTGKKLVVDMVKVIEKQGSGYVDYLWYSFEDPNEWVPKLSYVGGFKEWNWGIGTGIYLDDVKEELAAMNKKIMQVIFSILAVVLAISVLLIIQAKRSQSALFATQKALGEKEAVLEATLESSPDGILVMDVDGKVSHFNNKYLDIWNIPEEGKNVESHRDLVEYAKDSLENPDIADEIMHKCNAAKDKTEDIVKTNDSRFIEVRTTPLLTQSDDSGRVWLFRDITDRKQAEENMLSYIRFLESMDRVDHIIRECSGKELLPKILEELLDVFDCERSWILRPSNMGMEEWGFYDMKCKHDYYADVLDKTFPMDVDVKSCLKSAVKSKEPVIVGQGKVLNVPTIAVEHGVESLLMITIQPYNEGPWVFGLDNCDAERFWTESDITLFKEISRRLEYSLNNMLLTQDLRENENRLRTLINSMPDFVCFKDSEGRWLEANDIMLKVFKIIDADYRNKKGLELSQDSDVHKEALATCEETDEIAWEAGEISRFDKIIPDDKGNQLIFDVIKVPIFTKDGSRHGLVVVGRDITDRRRSEEEKERLLHILSEKNEELASIVFIASHDLRSPLVNIVGFSNELLASLDELKVVLDKGVTSKETMEKVNAIIEDDILMSINFINAGSKKMDKLLTGMLKLCRLGSEPLKIVKVDMNLMLNEILSTMQYQISQLDFSIKVEDLEYCYGDLNKINQVFSNLIDNAIKYRDPSRKPTIMVTSQLDDCLTTYCVEDNGKGIDASHVNKVFEVFHRLDPEENIKGEGLGLTIVKRIVNRLHGKIWVESVKDAGSKFFVSLPNAPFDA